MALPSNATNLDAARARRRSTVSASTTHRELLVAMRARIAETVDGDKVLPRDLAALTKRLADISRELEAMDRAEREAAGDDSAPADAAWTAV